MGEGGMKKLAIYFLVGLLGAQSAASYAQVSEQPAPKLKLAISEERSGGSPPTYHRLSVIVTNTSNEIFLEPGCSNVRGLYTISVVYRGAPLAEKDAAAWRRREAAEAAFCTHELGINEIKPGISFQRLLDLSERYDMSRPGKYEITVTRETDPEHLEKSVTVRSNAITIVVKPEDPGPK
jgi:hypothetical protein